MLRKVAKNHWHLVALALLLFIAAGAAMFQGSASAGSFALNTGQGTSANGGTLYSASIEIDGPEAYSDVLHFDQSSIGIMLNCQSDGSVVNPDDRLAVELHRVRMGLFDELVSTAWLPSNGRGDAVWENVGSGDYYFKFFTPVGGQRIVSKLSSLYSFEIDR